MNKQVLLAALVAFVISSPALAAAERFADAGDLIPVLQNIAVVGDAGEDPAPFAPDDAEALSVLKEARAGDLADISALWHLSQAYARAGETGMATLTSAEHDALTGRIDDAVILARRAAAMLPNGSPGWLRAQDILRLEKTRE